MYTDTSSSTCLLFIHFSTFHVVVEEVVLRVLKTVVRKPLNSSSDKVAFIHQEHNSFSM